MDTFSASMPASTPAPESLADDLLRGAEAIAEFLYGDATQRRKVYHLAETSRLPIFRLGSVLCARKSVLIQWISEQEKRGWRPERKFPQTHPAGATVARSATKASDGAQAGGIHPAGESERSASKTEGGQHEQAPELEGAGAVGSGASAADDPRGPSRSD